MTLQDFSEVACISGVVSVKEEGVPLKLLRCIPGSSLYLLREYMQRKIKGIYQEENIIVIVLHK